MANQMEPVEAEAIAMLEASNPKAWQFLMSYINKLRQHERNKCEDTQPDKVQVHQGRARAFKDILDLHYTATKMLSG